MVVEFVILTREFPIRLLDTSWVAGHSKMVKYQTLYMEVIGKCGGFGFNSFLV